MTLRTEIRRAETPSTTTRKRPISSLPSTNTSSRLSPDNKKTRRMTMTPQATIPKHQPLNTTKMTARDRRLSYMPSTPINNRRESFYHRSPIRPSDNRLPTMPSTPINNRRETLYHRSPTRPKSSKPLSSNTSPLRAKLSSNVKPTINQEPDEDRPIKPLSFNTSPMKAKSTNTLKSTTRPDSDEDKPTGRLLNTYGIPVQQSTKKVTPERNQHITLEEFLSSKGRSIPNRGNPTQKQHNSMVVSSTIKPAVYNELHQRIRVCVRKRPLNRKEIANLETDIAPLVGNRTIQLNAPK